MLKLSGHLTFPTLFNFSKFIQAENANLLVTKILAYTIGKALSSAFPAVCGRPHQDLACRRRSNFSLDFNWAGDPDADLLDDCRADFYHPVVDDHLSGVQPAAIDDRLAGLYKLPRLEESGDDGASVLQIILYIFFR
jgi:hypothetical protein